MSSSQPISRILQRDRVIAVVGLSINPQRPSNEVAAYLQSRGLRIVPVNPAYAGNGGKVLGEICYPDLASAARALAAEGSAIDMVDVFRRSAEVVEVARAAVAIKAKTLWLQLGVINEEAAAIAAAAGLDVVMDHCTKIEFARLAASGVHAS